MVFKLITDGKDQILGARSVSELKWINFLLHATVWATTVNTDLKDKQIFALGMIRMADKRWYLACTALHKFWENVEE